MPTLLARHHPLASSAAQLERLSSLPLVPDFAGAVALSPLGELRATGVEVLQMNVGKVCNQTCHHCHVDAGPDRSESMSDAVMDACLRAIETTAIPTLDITGGAPELHPRFRELVERGVRARKHVIDRCNLTVLTVPKYHDLPGFFAAHGVEVVSSLPYFDGTGTDAQRGDGVFAKSIEALQRLNAVGYGVEGSGLTLVLVSNPVGAFLPPAQGALEAQFKRELGRRYGIRFNRLITITNMPISRYLDWLERSGNTERYMSRLAAAFNPAAAARVMCRTTLSVGWDGTLYDCDFNQMLDLPLGDGSPRTIFDLDVAALSRRRIVTGNHCFGCTAGGGSSCGGALD